MKYSTKRTCQRWLYGLTAVMMAITVLFSGGAFGTLRPAADDDTQQEHVGVLRLSNFDFWINGEATTPGMEVSDGDEVKMSLRWYIENNQTYKDGDKTVKYTVFEAALDTLDIDITQMPLNGGDPMTLYDSDGKGVIGTYTVYNKPDEDGNVKTYFRVVLDDEIAETRSNVGGGALLDGTVSINKGGKVENGQKCVVGFGTKNVDVTYNDDGASGKTTVTKKTDGNVRYDEDSKKFVQDYIITVTLTGLLKDPVLNDDLANDELTLIGTPTSEPACREYIEPGENGHGFTMKFDDVPKGETVIYTVKYSVEVPTDTVHTATKTNDLASLKNTVDVMGYNSLGEPKTGSASATPAVVLPKMEKTSAFVKKNKTYDSSKADTIYALYDDVYYVFIDYTVTITTGTGALDLDSDYINEFLVNNLKDIVTNNQELLYPLSYSEDDGVVHDDGEEVEKAKRVLATANAGADGYVSQLLRGDFVRSSDGTKYTLTYQLAQKVGVFDNDILQKNLRNVENSLKTVYNTVELPDPVDSRDFPFKDTKTSQGNVGIDIAYKKADGNTQNSLAQKFSAYVDFGRLQEYYNNDYEISSTTTNKIDFTITDKLDDDYAYYVSDLSVTSAALQSNYDFLSNFNVSFKDDNNNDVYIYFNPNSGIGQGSYVLAPDPNNGYCTLNFASGMTADTIVQWYQFSGSAVTKNDNPLNNNSIFFPFSFKYTKDSFTFENFDPSFFKLLVKNNITMIISYSAVYNPDTTKTSGYVSNTVNLDYKFNHKDDTASKYPKQESDKATGSTLSNPVLNDLKKSLVEEAFVAVNYTNLSSLTGNAYYYQPTGDGIPESTANCTNVHVPYNADDTITWKIEVPAEVFQRSNGFTYYVSDTLPAGLEYVEGSLVPLLQYDEAYTSDINAAARYFALDAEQQPVKFESIPQENGSTKLTFTFSGADSSEDTICSYLKGFFDINNGNQYGGINSFPLSNGIKTLKYAKLVFIYETKIKEGFLDEQAALGKSTYTFTNAAEPIVNGKGLTGSTASKSVNTPRYLRKDGELNRTLMANGYLYATYTLNINESGEDLISDGDSIVLTDQLPEHFILDLSSIKIEHRSGNSYSTRTNEYLDKISYDSGNNILTITLNDEQAYRITYGVKIDLDATPDWYIVNDVTNTASIDGLAPEAGESSYGFAKYSAKASVWSYSMNGGITLYKFYKDAKGEEHDLAGAKFRLYTVFDNNDNVYMDGESVGEPIGEILETDENGNLEINDLQLDLIYKLVEVEAPDVQEVEGLEDEEDAQFADSHKHGFYFYLPGKFGVNDPRDIDANGNEELTALKNELISELGEDSAANPIPTFNDGDVVEYENIISIDLDGQKTWNIKSAENENYLPAFNEDPDENPVQLILKRRTGTDVDWEDAEQVENAELVWHKPSADNVWKYTFKDLAKYDGKGNRFEYRVTEASSKGYKPTYSGDNNENITNNLETVKLDITKEWLGDENCMAELRPDSITLDVYVKGESEPVRTITLKISDDKKFDGTWKFEIDDLPKYDITGENELEYEISERKVPGYGVAEKTEVDKTSGDISYTAVNSLDVVDISVTKKWTNDEKYVSGGNVRPDVTLVLMDGEREVERYTIKAEDMAADADEWSYTFTNLPKYDSDGKAIEYSIVEDGVPARYQPSAEPGSAAADDDIKELAFTVTNDFVEDYVSMTIKKTWNDNGNADSLRPDSITVQVYADGEAYGDIITLTNENTSEDDPDVWVISLTLPEYSGYKLQQAEDGAVSIVGDKRIVYTVKEVELGSNGEYYIPSYDDDDSDGELEIVNSLDLGETEISITKKWDDDSDVNGVRPESITVRLLADGAEFRSEKISAAEYATDDADVWSYTFDKLPEFVYRNGKQEKIVYTVEEDAVYGYDSAIDNGTFTITNSLVKISIIADKMDVANNEELDGAKLVLSRDGSELDSWTSKKGEKWEISGLIPGVEYTIKETETPDGYTTAADTVFTVDEEGNINIKSGSNASVSDDKVLIIDDSRISEGVSVNKMDVANNVEIDGATLALIDEDGNTVAEWKSEKGKKWNIDGLTPGNQYTIRETETPDGYETAADTVFTIDSDGNVSIVSGEDASLSGGVIIIDDKRSALSAVINKFDIANGVEVEGATLRVYNSSGELLGEWVSEKGKTWTLEGLVPGEKYTVKETVTPDGYDTIKADIIFTVDEDGKITVVSGSDGIVDKDTGVLLVNNTIRKTDSESSSGSSSSSSDKPGTGGGGATGGDEVPDTGSLPARACAACALICFTAAVVIGKKDEE